MPFGSNLISYKVRVRKNAVLHGMATEFAACKNRPACVQGMQPTRNGCGLSG